MAHGDLEGLKEEYEAWTPDPTSLRPVCLLHDEALIVERSARQNQGPTQWYFLVSLSCPTCGRDRAITLSNTVDFQASWYDLPIGDEFKQRRFNELTRHCILILWRHQRLGWRYYDALVAEKQPLPLCTRAWLALR